MVHKVVVDGYLRFTQWRRTMVKVNGEWAIVVRELDYGCKIIRFEEDRKNILFFLDSAGNCSILS